MMDNLVSVAQGTSPIILAFPHTGAWLPQDIAERLNENGEILADSDWHIDRLYADLLPAATVIKANFHRYVIDANRDPTGVSLYPGQNTTTLVPQTDFDGKPIWKKGAEPDLTDIKIRRQRFHQPYHAVIEAEIHRVRAIHGIAVLYDCHSIRSKIPFLFSGTLPDFNIGTDNNRTADRRLSTVVTKLASSALGYTSVANGRFKGGWTTRHYGRPAEDVHAIQMELAQSTYLVSEAAPFDYDEEKAAGIRPDLGRILKSLEQKALEIQAMKGKTR